MITTFVTYYIAVDEDVSAERDDGETYYQVISQEVWRYEDGHAELDDICKYEGMTLDEAVARHAILMSRKLANATD